MVGRSQRKEGGTTHSGAEVRVFRALLDVEGHLPSMRLDEEEVTLPIPVEYQLVHASRHGLEVAKKFGESAYNALVFPPELLNMEQVSLLRLRKCPIKDESSRTISRLYVFDLHSLYMYG